MTTAVDTWLVTRILPPEEWHRLQGTALETLAPQLRPEDTQIIAVEREGAIVGTWAVTRMVHVEGLWMHPEYRRSPSIGRTLLHAMQRAARAFGASIVWTGAENDATRRLLARAGACPVPFDSYILPIPPEGT